MKEVRVHGRGGQGAVIGTEMLATSFVKEGQYVAAFPFFGVERRGAPVSAFLRFDNKPVKRRCKIYSPDCLIILDSALVHSPITLAGLKNDCIFVLNSTKLDKHNSHTQIGKIGIVDATGIALEELNRPITNTCMLGAFAKTTGWLTLNSILSALTEYFEGEAFNNNASCVKRGFEETRIVVP